MSEERKKFKWFVHAAWGTTTVLALVIGVSVGSSSTDDEVTSLAEAEAAMQAEREAYLEQIFDLETALEGKVSTDEELEPVEEPVVEQDEEIGRSSIGDAVYITENGVDALILTVSKVDTFTKPKRDYGDPPRNGNFVVFKVDLEGLGSTSISESDFYVLVDGERFDEGDGNAWDAVVNLDDTLGYVDINAGEKRSGLVTFDLPATSGTLLYDPNWRSEPIVSWEFDGS